MFWSIKPTNHQHTPFVRHPLYFSQPPFFSYLLSSPGRLVAELRSGVDEDTDPQDLSPQQVARLHQLLQEARFRDPDGAHLSPAGEYNLRLGILKEIQPDMVATWQGTWLVRDAKRGVLGWNANSA